MNNDSYNSAADMAMRMGNSLLCNAKILYDFGLYEGEENRMEKCQALADRNLNNPDIGGHKLIPIPPDCKIWITDEQYESEQRNRAQRRAMQRADGMEY